jgi:hypothetical protein
MMGAAATSLKAQSNSFFDGKSLSGWTIQHGPPDAFRVENGELVVGASGDFPCWLKSDRMYENFDFSGEIFLKGWANGGIYFGAPEHDSAFCHPMDCGIKINIFNENEGGAKTTSLGAIFPVVAPTRMASKSNVWLPIRIRFEWPHLEVWVDGQPVQNLAIDYLPELRWRLRRGYFGFENQGHPIRFRNLKMVELPSTDPSVLVYGKPADLDNWVPLKDGDHKAEEAAWVPNGNVLRADGLGYLATKQKYQDFYLQMYVRQSKRSNGGVYFRLENDKPSGDRYEIQMYDVPSANYATGSLYGIQRAKYPRIEPEGWFLFQLAAKGTTCTVRINGESIVEGEHLKRQVASPILLQAHQKNRWIDYQDIRITKL